MPQWSPEQTIRSYHDLVQPHVPEPLLAVGVLQPAGTWGNFPRDDRSTLVPEVGPTDLR